MRRLVALFLVNCHCAVHLILHNETLRIKCFFEKKLTEDIFFKIIFTFFVIKGVNVLNVFEDNAPELAMNTQSRGLFSLVSTKRLVLLALLTCFRQGTQH